MDTAKSDIYQKNKQAIERVFPKFFENLARARKIDTRPEDFLDFEFLDGKKGFPTFSVTDNSGRTVYGHSLFDPVREAGQKYKKLVDEKWDRLIVFGFGFGYHIDYILKNTEDKLIMVIEPCITIFEEAMKRVDLTPILDSGRIMITFSVDPAELGLMLSTGVSPINMPELKSVDMPWIRLMPTVEKVLKESISNFRDGLLFNLYTNRLGGPVMWSNVLENFHFASRSPGLNHFKDCLKGKPIFVVAPGPSLEKNMHQLKRVKGRALIVAVDTATRILLKNGIEPDMITTIDFQQENYDKLKGVDTSFAYLLPAIEVCPDIPRHHKGRIISYYHSSEVESLYDPVLGPKGKIISGGSVLCDAVHIALQLGADPLILMGVDLGFPGKKWYADGSFEDGEFTRDLHEGKVMLLDIPDVFGNPMITYKSFFAFLRVLATLFPRIENKVYDATEGGAFIKGAEPVTAEEVIDLHVNGQEDPRKVLDELHDSFNPMPGQEVLDNLDTLIQQYKDVRKITRRGLRSSDRALALVDKIDKKSGKFIKNLQTLIDLKHELREKKSEMNFLAPLLDLHMARIFQHDSSKLEDPTVPSSEKRGLYREVVELDKGMHEGIKSAVEEVIEHFEEVRKKMETEVQSEETV